MPFDRPNVGMLPQAHTCENILELPNYWDAAQVSDPNVTVEDVEGIIRDRLTCAIENTSGYGLDEGVSGETSSAPHRSFAGSPGNSIPILAVTKVRARANDLDDSRALDESLDIPSLGEVFNHRPADDLAPIPRNYGENDYNGPSVISTKLADSSLPLSTSPRNRDSRGGITLPALSSNTRHGTSLLHTSSLEDSQGVSFTSFDFPRTNSFAEVSGGGNIERIQQSLPTLTNFESAHGHAGLVEGDSSRDSFLDIPVSSFTEQVAQQQFAAPSSFVPSQEKDTFSPYGDQGTLDADSLADFNVDDIEKELMI